MSDRTYPELDVDEMLAEGSTEDTTTESNESNTEPDTAIGYSQGKLPRTTLGIVAIVVMAILSLFGIWEYFPSNKQRLREAKSQVEKLEGRNAALSEQLKTQEAYSRLSEREAEHQTRDKEVMLKDIRACAEILRPYGGN